MRPRHERTTARRFRLSQPRLPRRGARDERRKTWAVIWLCGAMMVAEIVGGWLFGSIALIADGLHMSTHAGALLLAALAYIFARRYADDPRFTFGTGKFGDLAGFTSAAHPGDDRAPDRLRSRLAPVRAGADPIRRGDPDRGRRARRQHRQRLAAQRRRSSPWARAWPRGMGHARPRRIEADRRHGTARIVLDVFEDGVPPRFRLRAESGPALDARRGFGRDGAAGRRAAGVRLRRPRRLSRVRSTKSPSRTHSGPMSRSTARPTPSSSRSMSTPRAPPRATTICAPPSSMSWPTRPCR